MAEIVKLDPQQAAYLAALENNLSVELERAYEAGVAPATQMQALMNLVSYALAAQGWSDDKVMEHLREVMPVHMRIAREQWAMAQKVQRSGRLDG